eukprot:gene14023-19959_t
MVLETPQVLGHLMVPRHLKVPWTLKVLDTHPHGPGPRKVLTTSVLDPFKVVYLPQVPVLAAQCPRHAGPNPFKVLELKVLDPQVLDTSSPRHPHKGLGTSVPNTSRS